MAHRTSLTSVRRKNAVKGRWHEGNLIHGVMATIAERKKRLRQDLTPRSMTELGGGDLCRCGSGKRYRKCHRGAARARLRELRGDPRRAALCDLFM